MIKFFTGNRDQTPPLVGPVLVQIWRTISIACTCELYFETVSLKGVVWLQTENKETLTASPPTKDLGLGSEARGGSIFEERSILLLLKIPQYTYHEVNT